MSLGLMAMLAGVFVVPVVLLVLGHRLRRRGARWQRAFWGAVIAHVVMAPIALVAAMSPAAEWAPADTLRGALGFWSLLVVPAIGGLVGALVRRRA
jgi:ABC-type spermidine/putrescine transport system permease subunit II